MNRTVLQVPINSDLRKAAEIEAKEQGFSSLQDAVRIFLKKLADKAIGITFEEKTIQLSQKNEKRYLKMTRDFEKGKNIYKAKDVEDLIRQLNGDTLS